MEVRREKKRRSIMGLIREPRGDGEDNKHLIRVSKVGHEKLEYWFNSLGDER